MNIDYRLSHCNLYICLYCGVIDNKEGTRKHIWRYHKDKEINKTIKDLDKFLQTVSAVFMHRYKLLVEMDDLVQYLRTSIFIMLRDKYNPVIGTPEYFAKASCNNFLKRFLQAYHYKSNKVHIEKDDNPISSRRRDVCLNDDLKIVQDYDINNNKPAQDKWWIIEDKRTIDAISDMETKEVKEEIYSLLTPLEREVFDFITDESEKFTQKKIAEVLGVSQPLISYRIRLIRKKAENLLSILKV